ncbi:hypothetical protein [Variovorax sp. J31P179]|uniref:hypothetical protein n=1 Tax=Variovorax sp. J31P179 TaxID=3053508 RepID=UPI00257875C7|nr:hypothetical protein [Variovorax sp. J31P179]
MPASTSVGTPATKPHFDLYIAGWGAFVSIQNKPGTTATIGHCLFRTLLCVVAIPSISDDPAHAPPSARDLPGRSMALRIPAPLTEPPIDFDLPFRILDFSRSLSCPADLSGAKARWRESEAHVLVLLDLTRIGTRLRRADGIAALRRGARAAGQDAQKNCTRQRLHEPSLCGRADGAVEAVSRPEHG